MVYEVGTVSGSLWAFLVFLAAGLSGPFAENRPGAVSWEFLVMGCAAFAGGMLGWLGEGVPARRFPVLIGLSVIVGGLGTAWITLARGSAAGREADLALGVFIVGLAVSALLILPCLGRVVSPQLPLSGAARMLAYALFGFIGGGVVFLIWRPYGVAAMIVSVALTALAAGLDGFRRVPRDQRRTWFVANAFGVGIMHLTLLLVLTTLVSVDP